MAPDFLLVGFEEVEWQTVLWLAKYLQDSPSFHRLGGCYRKVEILVNPPVPGYVPDSMVGDLANRASIVGLVCYFWKGR